LDQIANTQHCFSRSLSLRGGRSRSDELKRHATFRATGRMILANLRKHRAGVLVWLLGCDDMRTDLMLNSIRIVHFTPPLLLRPDRYVERTILISITARPSSPRMISLPMLFIRCFAAAS
jgi:hypothetical protein